MAPNQADIRCLSPHLPLGAVSANKGHGSGAYGQEITDIRDHSVSLNKNRGRQWCSRMCALDMQAFRGYKIHLWVKWKTTWQSSVTCRCVMSHLESEFGLAHIHTFHCTQQSSWLCQHQSFIQCNLRSNKLHLAQKKPCFFPQLGNLLSITQWLILRLIL